MSTIQIQNLSKVYDYYKKQPGLVASLKGLFKREKLYTEAVKSISFDIEEGELVGFLGPNGAGKTTTLKMLSGILHPSSGSASVLGYTPHKRQKEYQKQFALVMGQKNQLWWDLPAMESFILNKEIYEVSDEDFKTNLDELVELLDIKDILDVQVRKLSLGQRMKCELVAALLHKPRILFLDEPTIGLDVVAQKNIRDFLKRYNQQNKTTIILTSHYMEDIKELCRRVIIIDHGQIGYDGPLDDLVKQYADHKILHVDFDHKVETKTLDDFGKIKSFDGYSADFMIDRDAVKEASIKLLSSSLPIVDIGITEVPIDDVIRKIFVNK